VANETIEKFGYPGTLLAEYEHWTVLLRGLQNTLGCMVLACKEDAESMAEVSSAAFAELPTVTAAMEGALRAAFSHDKINYLLLMMVDRHVHFHVLPRYAEARSFEGVEFPDPGWPRAPALGEAPEVTPELLEALRLHLKDHWPQ
jgi:diadenosine tetraphosphate (Ap4A) HIT family hydrolase